MVTEWFLNAIYSVISVLIAPLELVFQPIGSMAGLVELMSYASIFIPVGIFATCISIWAGYYILRLVMTLINWGIAKIPTIE